MLIRQQLLAFPAYLIYNVSGQKNYPKNTNHFFRKSSSLTLIITHYINLSPTASSILFTGSQRNAVIASNFGLGIVGVLVWLSSRRFGAGLVIALYGIPWLMVTHWFIMITYLHHTDPRLPHYRKGTWNYQVRSFI